MKENKLSENDFLDKREKSPYFRRIPRAWFVSIRQFAYKNHAVGSLGHVAFASPYRLNKGGVLVTPP